MIINFFILLMGIDTHGLKFINLRKIKKLLKKLRLKWAI